ncbi:MAG: hypothetical protein ABIO72_00700, partial [Patescibacteria group bacterium]
DGPTLVIGPVLELGRSCRAERQGIGDRGPPGDELASRVSEHRTRSAARRSPMPATCSWT